MELFWRTIALFTENSGVAVYFPASQRCTSMPYRPILCNFEPCLLHTTDVTVDLDSIQIFIEWCTVLQLDMDM